MNREILLRARGFLGDILLDPPVASLRHRQTEGPYRELAKSLESRGYLLRTMKTLVGQPVAEIHVNVQPIKTQPAFLLRMESGYVVPENDDLQQLNGYTRVFTWDRNLARGCNFEYVPHPQDLSIPMHGSWPTWQERPLSFCLIAANKMLRRPTSADLYVERQRIIRWFERHAPSDFELYGRNWNLPMASRTAVGLALRGLGKLGLVRGRLVVYRGEIPDKVPVLRRSRFAFALENVEGLEGYLTEKLFDCLYEGCIPIYLGDPGVSEILPNEVYVPYFRGQSLKELYANLTSMSSAEYSERQAAIRGFLGSEACRALSSQGFARRVSDVVASCVGAEGLSNGQ